MSTLRANAVQTVAGKPILNSTGSILQVKSAILGSNTTTSSTSYVAVSGLTVDMTPSNANNNYLAIASMRHNNSYGSQIQVNSSIFVNGSYKSQSTSSGNDGLGTQSHSIIAWGTFGSTGSTTFQIYFAQGSGTSTTLVANDCVLTVFEVVA